jgi:hypothetical protein
MTRRLPHLLILGLLAGLSLLNGLVPSQPPLAPRPISLFGGGPPTAQAAEQAPPAPITAQAAPNGAPLGPPIPAQLPAARPPTTWLQTVKPTVLWTTERPDAANQAGLSQWAHLRLAGFQVGSRLPVEYPGDGQARLPLRGWVEALDVGPAGRPAVEHELAFGGNVSPVTGAVVPRRIVQAWPQGITAQYAALVDEASGEVLWGRDAHGRVAPASLTKIVTSLVALDRARPTDRVTVRVDSRDPYFWESTVMGLKAGENLALETLLFGLMLPSGNDAALAIAQHVAGSEPAFAGLMNAKVAELGLANSRFVNPHGLDAEGQYSSPFDLATLSRLGMRNPTFQRLAGSRTYTAEGYSMANLNRLIGSYPKADGVKVGYTDAAGRAIVASATQDGRRLYVALLRSANPAAEAQALLEWAFRGFAWQ